MKEAESSSFLKGKLREEIMQLKALNVMDSEMALFIFHLSEFQQDLTLLLYLFV